MEETDERLSNIYKFILSIIIDEDSMYDFREISKKVLYGIYDYNEAYNEWKKLGHIVL